jgi:hypothetical protein
MDLYIFDRELNFIGVLDAFTSLQWNRRYLKCGDFELQCPLTMDNLNLLAKGNIIWKQGDTEAGYINYRNLKQDTDGKETLDIKGNFLTGYLKQRIVWNIINMNDTVENIMRALVNQNCINPADSKRIIPNLILGDLKSLVFSTNYIQDKHNNLGDEMEALSALSNLGHRINLDVVNKKLIFEVYAGVDRSVNQSAVSPCIFSKEFENVLEQEYTDSNDNLKNVELVNGTYTPDSSGDSTAVPVNQSVTIGNTSGLDRYETFLDSGDISASGKDENGNDITITEQDALNMLMDKGNTDIVQYQEVQTFDSKINVNSNLVYKQDFDLGDIVTCTSKKWGITLDARITEIGEVYEEQGPQVNVTFGNNVPTLIDKIKQKSQPKSSTTTIVSVSAPDISVVDGGSF